MTGPARIVLKIDTLRVTGATRAEAQALAAALRQSLAASLSVNPAAMTRTEADYLSVTLPATAPDHPVGLGYAAGQHIAAALAARKGGK